MSSNKLQVVKIPNPYNDGDKKGEPLARMPRMYLELLENKNKVKPNMLNKEYEPSETSNQDNDDLSSFSGEDSPKKMDKISERDEEESEISDFSFQKKSDKSLSDSDEISSNGSRSENENNNFDRRSESSSGSFNSKKEETKEKLRNLLKTPPKLSSLEKEGVYQNQKVMPNLNNIEQLTEEDEENLKRELLFKFELLKKSYKNVDIPEFTIHSDFKKMNDTYENLLRHVSLDSSVESYKNILVGGFMIFEFVFGVWLKFDMSGFTQQQILNMHQYEKLLIELGEKSYVPEGKQWPVEVRLLGLITMNAVIFIVSRMILKRTGSNLMGMMNSMKAPISTPSSDTPKKKMRGPNINFDL